MILPIYKLGQSVLRKETETISQDYPELDSLIKNMYETMYNAEGVGLAAPQVGLSIRLIVIDLKPFIEDDPELGAFKVTMINPEIIEESEEVSSYDEGCLSIPGISETVIRPESIRVTWLNEQFEEQEADFSGFKARVIQHEVDHLEGKLFIDRIKPLRRQLLKSKLDNIAKGKVTCSYKIK